jgi:hypothetical protein
VSENGPKSGEPDVICSVLIREFAGGRKEIQVVAQDMLYAAGLMSFFVTRIHNDVYARDKKAAEGASSRIEQPRMLIPPGLLKQ